jgi:hypothetical protein
MSFILPADILFFFSSAIILMIVQVGEYKRIIEVKEDKVQEACMS